MKNLLSILILFYFTSTAYSQTANDIVGNWQFSAIAESAKLDDSKKATVSSLLQGLTFNFTSDNKFTASILGIAENGTWLLKGKSIELQNDKGSGYTIEILDYKKDLITLKLKSMQFVMARAGSQAALPVAPTNKAVGYVSATKAQVSKKWFLTSKTAPDNLTQKQKDALGELLSGSYTQLKVNGTYTVEISGITETGTWKLAENNTAIITRKGTDSKLWHIVKIAPTQLVLVLGNTDEEWTFSTEE
ncbi:lipocalin family protein [Flavobacterium subsaxonicum]|uniref:Lipocalin-like domain-containing protein n=1 Tax=Flavobacterium subsaxonicum WB 4.1-42 = DSM 21790 TaxID=1121898 RepID=A0A0A2N360_9FLAO|nr:lipocalin family protein [Flavobacterium subsaxonicum]KGO94895.1 hypothetical protein Q766_01915 [Flavobacterium subsaxonicum WB 4.1-42 = DSM 21790]